MSMARGFFPALLVCVAGALQMASEALHWGTVSTTFVYMICDLPKRYHNYNGDGDSQH